MGAEQFLTAHFHLRPHLHDLLLSLCGEAPRFDPRDSVGMIVRVCLQRPQPAPLDPTFVQRRRRFTFLISHAQRLRYGCWASQRQQERFEQMVQHLFDEKMLSHVDVAQRMGQQLRASIRQFMDLHDIGAEHCDYNNLRTTVDRMRARREKFRTSVPPAPIVRR